ncbi:MAG: isopentenyl-diphosphate delta-isomerase [Gammaproteobacteria bacterium]|nr:isopentenyl-diphosphate delta-isomerase [Gammaproteobacteria bacterium]
MKGLRRFSSQCKTVTEKYIDEALILVDENDREVGSALKEDCHLGDGLLHRAFSVFIINDKKEVLIQKRSKEKMLWGQFWSNACCSHPRLGEDIEDAAHRRVKEELSIETNLDFLFKFKYQEQFKNIGSENELCHVFIGKCNEKPQIDRSEISDWKYITIEKLTQSIEERPSEFTPWLKTEWSEIIGTHSNLVERILAAK